MTKLPFITGFSIFIGGALISDDVAALAISSAKSFGTAEGRSTTWKTFFSSIWMKESGDFRTVELWTLITYL